MGAKNRARPPKAASAPETAGSWIAGAIGIGWIILVAALNRDAIGRSLKFASVGVPFHLFKIPGFGVLRSLGCAVAIFAAALLFGRASFQAFAEPETSLEEELIFGLGLGLGALSLIALGLGLAGCFSPNALRCAVGAIGVLGLVGCFLVVPKRASGLPPRAKAAASSRLIACALLALVVLNFVGALGPEVFFDCLVYHLGLPKLYLISHRIVPTTNNIYSGLPFNTEMLYSVALAVGGEAVAKLIPWLMSLAVLFAIFYWVSRRSGVQAALLAMLIYYSFPITADMNWRCYVEMAWCFYGFLAFIAVVDGLTLRSAVLGGIFIGLCMGTKYNAAVVSLLVVSVLAMKAFRRQIDWSRFAVLTAVAAITAAAILSPWLIKNAVFYKNPVFPFFNDWFSHAPQTIDWKGLVADAKGRDLASAFSSFAGIAGLFKPIWPRIASDDSYYFAFALYFLLPWLFVFRRGEVELEVAVGLGFLLTTMYTSQVRFLYFLAPLLAILIATNLMAWAASGVSKKLAWWASIAACLLSMGQIAINWQNYGTWAVVFGLVDERAFLSHVEPVYPAPSYPAIEFINEQLPPTAKVLFLYESRGFHADRPFIATSAFAQNPIVPLANEARNGSELASRLQALGITHVLLNKMEMYRTGSSLMGLTDAGKAAIDDFLKNGAKRVFESRIESQDNLQWVDVYEVRA